MEQTIVKTDNYLLVVDDSEIKKGDYRVNIQRGYVKLADKEGLDYYNKRSDVFKKAIAHLPLNDSPILEGVMLLPPLEVEDNVEKLGIERAIERKWNPNSLETKRVANEIITAVSYGYNKAREKYSLSNILDLYIKETARGMDMWSKEENETMTTIGNIIESLSQPKMPTQFLFEMEMCPTNHASGLKLTGHQLMDKAILQNYKIKTTTNSQGQEVACGKYIFEL